MGPYSMKFLFSLFLLLFCCLSSVAQINVTEVYLSADKSIDQLFINGEETVLKKDASHFASTRNYGPIENLKSIAVEVTANKQAGFIAMLKTEKHYITSDATWKVFPSNNDAKPPKDKNGNSWSHPDYDDSHWEFATIDGRFGIPPWGIEAKPQEGYKSLKESMRIYSDKKVLFQFKASLLNANWIWHGNATYPVKKAFIRRSFAKNSFNKTLPPTKPFALSINKVSKTSASFSWKPAFSPLGEVKYRVYWNGLHVKTVQKTKATLDDLLFTKLAQNYIYIRAEDTHSNLSKPSQFKIVKVKDKTLPETPKNLTVARTGPNLVELSWSPAKDNTKLRNYKITVAKTVFFAPATSTNFRHAGKRFKPDTEYTAELVAIDLDRNNSKPIKVKFRTTKKGYKLGQSPIEPTKDFKPQIRLTGLTDRTAVLRWGILPKNITSAQLKIKDKSGKAKNIKLPYFLNQHQEIKGLSSGTDYTASLVAQTKDEKTIISNKINFTTVQLPKTKPIKTIASLTTPDTRWQNFGYALDDGKKEACEFFITFGNHGPQDKARDEHWERFMKAVKKVETDMPVFMSPSSHDVQAALLDPIDPEIFSYSSGKYNRYMHHTGRKLNEVIDRDGIRIIWSLSKIFGNQDGELFVQNAIHEADQNPSITHIFILCTFQEAIADWEKILANTSKPIITLDRYTNGNPGYAITWDNGDSFIQVSSQRNRAKTADYQKIHIYQDKVYFEQRSRDVKTGKYKTSLVHAVEYNRQSQHIKPSMIRNRHTSGVVIGSNQQINTHPWATNKTITVSDSKKVDFKLSGVCPLGKKLKFTIFRKPSQGNLIGESNQLSWQPPKNFKGEEYLLFQVDNGHKSQLGWILFKKN